MINTWEELFEEIKEKDYAKKINTILNQEYATHTIFPPRNMMFNAFKYTPLKAVKVVIIGQDPYHEDHQAMGLSFSVPKGVVLPPSLINIFKEIENNLSIINGDKIDDIREIASNLSYNKLNRIIKVVNEARNNLKSNTNLWLTLDSMLISILEE